MEQEDILPLQHLYFNEQRALYEMQYKHFDACIENDIPKMLTQSPNIFFEVAIGSKKYTYYFKIEDVSFKPAVIPGKDEYMFPEDARKGNLTYAIKLVATISQIQKIYDFNTGEEIEKVIGEVEKEHPIASIPVMVGSSYCNTNVKKDIKHTECEYDPGCYFIVKGNEKVVIGMERLCNNKLLVFIKKDINFEDSRQIKATVNSLKQDHTEMIQTVDIKFTKQNKIIVDSPYFTDVPVVIMLRALGIDNDKDIIDYICNDPNEVEMKNILRHSLNDIVMQGFNDKNGVPILIKDQDTAFLSLKTKIKKFRRVLESDRDIKEEQQKLYIINILKKDFLCHLGENLFNKAIYICQAINKMLKVYLNREKPDDRDSYENKRVDMPGTLMAQLFKQYYKRMMAEISKHFEKKYNGDDENPINVINQIRPNTIEQGLIQGLSTGTWGHQKPRKGVSQALQRYSYLQTISYFRRIVTQSVDSGTQKVTSIRHGRNNQYGFLDAVETPEGQKIGLQKHLALMSDITIDMKSQVDIIMNLIEDKVIDIINVHPYEYNVHFKILINGNWIGFSNDGYKFTTFLRDQRRNNYIDRHVSIIFDIKQREIRIYTDIGRMIRPLLIVKNNQLVLTKKMVDDIDLNGIDKNKVCRWSQFLLKYHGVVKYVDVEEANTTMIAMLIKDLKEHEKRMKTPIKNPNPSGDIVNRYNDTVYKLHTHCEFHPSMQLGSSSACIPAANKNQAPRNIYNFSQSKQGKGIAMTNERFRIDISYRLANPSYPLVQTLGMSYLNTNKMPNGENCYVMIGVYTGFNQEDSLVFNQSALERGLFRSYNYKKYVDEIKKNPSTSQDDQFTKPDPTKVTGIRKANYEKLNSKGFIDVETKVVNGDVLIGKVSPLDPGTETNNKIHKDNSQVYKSNVDGHIDKAYTGIFNHDGYEMYSIQVRSERTPCIGDKFASRHGQKGTTGVVLPAADMPFTKDGIQPDLIMNPNAVPSRMTVGQLIECVFGKVAAIKGKTIDATPFNDYDMDSAGEILKEYGFDEYGYEDMYCGMTGKKIRNKMFIGPTYYMRLKHLVHDKIHARARGPRQVLTRQPPEGRARDGGLRFGEMERDCALENTLITLTNGLCSKIKNMENNNINVLGFDENKNGLVSSKQVGFLNKGTRPCIELTMEDGRKTVFTEDHPFLTEHNEWIKAKDLVINEDRLKVGITCPELDIEKEIKECDNWSLKLNDLTLNTDNKDNYLKTLAFARIVGLLITDGHINKDNEGSVFLGHKLDAEQFLEDLNMFCMRETYKVNKHCYTINIPKELMNNILKLNGLTIGRKVNQKAQLPEFVNNCPKPILREFLGAMFGGDGHTCFLGLHRGKRDILSSVGFSQSKTEENVKSLNDMMDQIKELLSKFDINEVTIQKPKEISDSKNKESNDKVYEIVLHIALDNLIKFSEKIGFRYCCHKLQRLEGGVSYKRLRTEVIRQHNWIVNRVDEITNYKVQKSANPTKNIRTKKAIIQAIKELKENEALIHEYAIPTTHDISDNLIKGTKFGSLRSGSFPTAEDFLKKINILDWFLDDSETAYGVERQKDYLPTMNMTVIGRRSVGEKPVYDISVDKTHSFLAEGVVAHNCMIAHGMGQFLKERLVDTSDQYFVHVCSSCGLFARKKPDKDIYICQLCNEENKQYTVHKVEMPYGFKLLIQELQAINILPKIKVDTDIYNENSF